MVIDTSFDFRKDTPDYANKDPDVHSPTLRRYHKLLWSKVLPSGARFDLDDTKPRHEACITARRLVRNSSWPATRSSLRSPQDLVTHDCADVRFFMPFDEFRTASVPEDDASTGNTDVEVSRSSRLEIVGSTVTWPLHANASVAASRRPSPPLNLP